MPVAELARGFPCLTVSGAQWAMCSSFLAQQRVSLSRCLQRKEAKNPGCGPSHMRRAVQVSLGIH